MIKNETKLKYKSTIPFIKNWKVGFVIIIIFITTIFILQFVLFDFAEGKLLGIFTRMAMSYIFIFISYYLISKKMKSRIIINDKGISQHNTGNIPFRDRDYFYSWESIEKIIVNNFFWENKIVIKLKESKNKIFIPYFLWEIDESSVDFKLNKLPKTNFGRIKFDKIETPIIKTLNYWKPEALFPDKIKVRTKK